MTDSQVEGVGVDRQAHPLFAVGGAPARRRGLDHTPPLHV